MSVRVVAEITQLLRIQSTDLDLVEHTRMSGMCGPRVEWCSYMDYGWGLVEHTAENTEAPPVAGGFHEDIGRACRSGRASRNFRCWEVL